MNNERVIILGAGLTGLHLAHLLTAQNRDFLLIESRDRIGGRVHSHEGFDLGPAWFWPHQARINALVDHYGLSRQTQATGTHALYHTAQGVMTVQHPSNQVSYRLQGGIARLCNAIYSELDTAKVLLNSPVTEVKHTDDGLNVKVNTGDDEYWVSGSHVVSTLPLRLLAASISFSPALPADTLVTMQRTPTWMASHAKALVEYATPFWQSFSHQGEAFSQVGPLMEIHDASQTAANRHALFGFIGYSPLQRQSMGVQTLKDSIVDQLVQVFGQSAATPDSVTIMDWSQETFTAVETDQQPLNYHPHYGLDQIAHWNNRLLLAGTETAIHQGGFLEGALESAQRAFKLIESEQNS